MGKKSSHANPRIEALLSGNLHIDAFDALHAYTKYMRELDYLRSGGSYSDLGFAERRQSSMIMPGEQTLESLDRSLGSMSAAKASDAFAHVDDNGRTFAYTQGDTTVAYITLSGVMRSDGGPSASGIAQLADTLVAWAGQEKITGIIVRGRSGGGESMSADILNAAIETVTKPVVVLADRLGSAAVMGTRNADEIIAASPRARFGSIGSYISLDRKLLKQYSKQIIDVYSDLSPDKNAEWRELFKGNLEPLRAMIRVDADEFREAMRASRPLRGSNETIEKTLSGGMFPAADAKARGLIDGVGTLSYAIRRVRALAA